MVTVVIRVDDEQCHKNPIFTIIVANKKCGKAVHYNEMGGLPTWGSYNLFQTPPEKTIISTVGSH